MKTEEYLDILTEQIRCRQARDPVQEEIRCHIEDQKEEFMKTGMREGEAEEAAVEEMGDPVETGIALDGIHRPKTAWWLILVTAVLGLAGFGIQYWLQARMPDVIVIYSNPMKCLLYLLIGVAVMCGICYMDYTRIAYRAKELLAGLFILLFLGMLFLGRTVNGSRTWIVIGGVSLNIRMLVLLAVPLYAAVLYHYRGEGYRALGKGVLWMLPFLFIAWSCPSTLTVITLFLTFFVILMTAVYKKWFRVSEKPVLLSGAGILFLLPAIGCFSIWLWGKEYQKMRLQVLLNPADRAMEGGYQSMAVRELLAGCRLIGENTRGLQLGKVIPESGDFVLTYVIAYYGILAAVLLLGAIVFLFLRLLKVSLRQKNQLGMLIGVGCCTVSGVQILIYLLGNLGITLFGGAYCPFLTNGGSGIVVTYALIGFLLSIYRCQNVVATESPIRKTKVKWKLVKVSVPEK